MTPTVDQIVDRLWEPYTGDEMLSRRPLCPCGRLQCHGITICSGIKKFKKSRTLKSSNSNIITKRNKCSKLIISKFYLN